MRVGQSHWRRQQTRAASAPSLSTTSTPSRQPKCPPNLACLCLFADSPWAFEALHLTESVVALLLHSVLDALRIVGCQDGLTPQSKFAFTPLESDPGRAPPQCPFAFRRFSVCSCLSPAWTRLFLAPQSSSTAASLSSPQPPNHLCHSSVAETSGTERPSLKG